MCYKFQNKWYCYVKRNDDAMGLAGSRGDKIQMEVSEIVKYDNKKKEMKD